MSAILCTTPPVPSGDPSSTMSMSILPSCTRTRSTRRSMFSRSLYVGTMTRARSDKAPPVLHHPQNEREDGKQQGDERDDLAAGDCRVLENEIHLARTLGERHADQVEVGADDGL